MALAFGILTVMAGAIYILWQVHKESKGFLSCLLIWILAFCGPLLLVHFACELNVTLGAVLGIAFIGALVVFVVHSIETAPQKQQEMMNESMAIWDEVYKLPLPDDDTIRAYKLANKIPLYPENCEVYTNAAIEKWRINEYNKRYTKKHKFVFYVK